MIKGDTPIHIMDGKKISKEFFAGVFFLLFFGLILGTILYKTFYNYDVFLDTVKSHQMTSIKAEAPITARDMSCPYQVHFQAINSTGQKISARYCGGFYFADGKINIKEILIN